MNYMSIIKIILEFLKVLIPGGIGGVLFSWLFIKYRISKQSSANITEEQLKKGLERNNELLYTTLNHYSGLRKEIHLKKINALDVIWQAFVNLKETIPATLKLYLAISKKEEFNYEKMSKTSYFDALKTQVGNHETDFQHAQQIAKICDSVELLRYLINQDLYKIWRSYLVVANRIVVIFSQGLQSKKITPWQDDKWIKKQLAMWLNKDEIEYIYNLVLGGFDQALEILRTKALNLILQETTGKKEIYNMLEQIRVYEQQDMLLKVDNMDLCE